MGPGYRGWQPLADVEGTGREPYGPDQVTIAVTLDTNVAIGASVRDTILGSDVSATDHTPALDPQTGITPEYGFSARMHSWSPFLLPRVE